MAKPIVDHPVPFSETEIAGPIVFEALYEPVPKALAANIVPSRNFETAAFLFFSVLPGLGLFGKTELIHRMTHLPLAAVKIALMLSAIAPQFWKRAVRGRRWFAPVFLAGLVFCSFVGFAKFEKLHEQGRGTDQPDCVIVASKGFAAGEWPYQPDKIWTHDPMSCGPGWVAIQAPFVRFLGYSSALVLLWIGSLFTIRRQIGGDRTLALLTLMGLSPGFWLAAANGADFLPFGVWVSALILVAAATEKMSSWWVLLVGMVAQFRFPTIFLSIYFSRRSAGTAGLAAASIAVLAQLGFLIWNGKSYVEDGPLWVIGKFFRRELSYSGSPSEVFFICGAMLIGLALSVLVAKNFGGLWATFSYLALAFTVPAAQDFMAKMHGAPSLGAALERWEGGMWLVACLPIAALILVKTQLSGEKL